MLTYATLEESLLIILLTTMTFTDDNDAVKIYFNKYTRIFFSIANGDLNEESVCRYKKSAHIHSVMKMSVEKKSCKVVVFVLLISCSFDGSSSFFLS